MSGKKIQILSKTSVESSQSIQAIHNQEGGSEPSVVNKGEITNITEPELSIPASVAQLSQESSRSMNIVEGVNCQHKHI